jgi:hypothetical protein
MRDELTQVTSAIDERDEKCVCEMKSIESKLSHQDLLRSSILSLATDSRISITSSDRKECSKIEAFKEHSAALKRHIDNTSAYLKKEVRKVEGKIKDAKDLMIKSVGISIDEL